MDISLDVRREHREDDGQDEDITRRWGMRGMGRIRRGRKEKEVEQEAKHRYNYIRE